MNFLPKTGISTSPIFLGKKIESVNFWSSACWKDCDSPLLSPLFSTTLKLLATQGEYTLTRSPKMPFLYQSKPMPKKPSPMKEKISWKHSFFQIVSSPSAAPIDGLASHSKLLLPPQISLTISSVTCSHLVSCRKQTSTSEDAKRDLILCRLNGP